MWDNESIETYTAILTDHERIVLREVMSGRNIQDVKDSVFMVLGPNYDEDYVDHLYSMIKYPNQLTKY